MLSKLYLKNFACFTELTLNFEQKNNVPNNFAFIYGENGSGKTNIVQSLAFLNALIVGKSILTKQANSLNSNPTNVELYKNYQNYLHLFDLKNLLNRYKKLNSFGKEMCIKVDFIFDKKRASYTIKTDDEKIIYEELKYEKNKNLSTVYKYENESIWFDEEFAFIDDRFKKETFYEFDKNAGAFTMLSIIKDKLETISNRNFIYKAATKDFIELLDNFNNILIYTNTTDDAYLQSDLNKYQITGKFHKTQTELIEKLKKEEDSLRLFYCSLYPRISNVLYKQKYDNDFIEYYLFFEEKDADNKTITVPYDFVSHGTKKLLDIYIIIKALCLGKTVIVDEIDTGIHDLMIKGIIDEVINNVGDNFKGQLIATTHNTLLMQSLNPKQIYILNEDYRGIKEFYPLSEFRISTQKTNNISKKYYEGDYGGIPHNYFSFEAFNESVNED